MWYTGFTGITWKIGYAYSSDGINGWTRTGQPIIDVGSSDGWEAGTESPSIIYNNQLNKFQMWYSSVKSTWGLGGSDRYRLRYAESSDGVDWQEGNWVVYGTSGKWDTGGPNRGSSVIFKDNAYHLWYAGTNEAFNWRIGYATSPDGVTWTKQNNGNPVVTPTQLWELNNVSFPTVIYENGAYHMWYTAGASDAPTQVVYANSTDGINWNKPADENPVINPGIGFDSLYLTVTGILHDTDAYKLYYSGFDGAKWAIGLATSSTIPTPDVPPTPTPTPTPSPTPTPTATPTPTPTPTPIPTTKVVVVPGFGASWNADAILNCNLDNYTGDWALASYAETIYNPLLTALAETRWMPKPFYYDWRKQVPQNGNRLNDFINAVRGDTEKVNLVGHSMGGLVGRAYVDQQTTNQDIARLMTVGSPHRGVPVSYPAWSAGVIWEDNFILKLAMTILVKHCGVKTKNDKEAMRTIIPSIQNLLPIDDYLRDAKTNVFKPVASMVNRNNWLPTTNFPPYFGAIMGTLNGTGKKTLQFLRVTNPSKRDKKLGIWEDGKAIEKEFSNEGDGTVLLTSSTLADADNRKIARTHTGLLTSSEGINQILDFLGTAPSALALLSTPSFTEPTSALLIIGYPAAFWVVDPSGKTIKDKDGLVSVINPKSGSYKLRFIPTKFRAKIIVGQFLEDGRVFWKEYTHNSILPKFSSINFSSTNPTEDALR